MRTSFHHQPEAQHPNFQLSTSWQADYPIFREQIGKHLLILSLTGFDLEQTFSQKRAALRTFNGYAGRAFDLDQ
jgi:hypothetical protein